MKINVPNALVILRLLLVPVIVILLLVNAGDITVGSFQLYITDLVAGVLFIFASITDFVDGWWARKYNQITDFGKLFDPLADKILVNSVLIIFGARGILPIIFVIIFICRDILVDGLRMMMASRNIVLAADKWGKLKTIFQMVGLSLLFFVHVEPVGFFDWTTWEAVVLIIPMMIALTFSIISGINYYVSGFKSMNQQEQN